MAFPKVTAINASAATRSSCSRMPTISASPGRNANLLSSNLTVSYCSPWCPFALIITVDVQKLERLTIRPLTWGVNVGRLHAQGVNAASVCAELLPAITTVDWPSVHT